MYTYIATHVFIAKTKEAPANAAHPPSLFSGSGMYVALVVVYGPSHSGRKCKDIFVFIFMTQMSLYFRHRRNKLGEHFYPTNKTYKMATFILHRVSR